MKKIFLLQSKAILPLSNEPSHDYVGLTGPELNAKMEGLRRVWLSVVGLFQGRKSKIPHEQNVIIFQFSIRITKFQAYRLNNIEKIQKGVDPLNDEKFKMIRNWHHLCSIT